MRFGIEKATKVQNENIELTFRELETLTSTGLTGLLTFLGTTVAGNQTGGFQSLTQRSVHLFESSCQAVAYCACLTHCAATVYFNVGVYRRGFIGNNQGASCQHKQLFGVAIFVDGLSVYLDFAFAVGKGNTGYRGLTASYAYKFLFFCHGNLRVRN